MYASTCMGRTCKTARSSLAGSASRVSAMSANPSIERVSRVVVESCFVFLAHASHLISDGSKHQIPRLACFVYLKPTEKGEARLIKFLPLSYRGPPALTNAMGGRAVWYHCSAQLVPFVSCSLSYNIT